MEAFNRMIMELEKRQEQLLQAKKLSSIGILASGISHQLNNPLNNVSTSIQILGEEFEQGDPAFMKRHLDNCGQEILRAQEIVKGLLDFARQSRVVKAPTDLGTLIREVVANLSLKAEGTGIRVSCEIQDELPQLMLDGEQIRQMLTNLLPVPREVRDCPFPTGDTGVPC